MTQLEHERMLICLTMRAEETRGESLERRHPPASRRALPRDRARAPHRGRNPAVARRRVRRRREPRSARVPASATRKAIRCSPRSSCACCSTTAPCATSTDAGRCARSATATCRRRSRGSWIVASSGCRRTRAASSTPRRSSAASFDIDLAMAAGAGPEDEVLDALDEGIAHAVIEATQDIAGQPVLVHARPARRRRAPHDQSAPAVAHSRARRRRDGSSARPTTSPRSRFTTIAPEFRRRRSGTRWRPAARRSAMYAHAEARRFFEIAERAASDPVERAQALHRLAEVAETEGRYALTEELCDRALAGLAGRAGRPRDSRAAPHARAHARAAGPAGERDDRRVPRAARHGAQLWPIDRRKRRCST